MIWLTILFLVVGLILGVHVHICAMSGQGSTARILVEFLLSMISIGIGALLGILGKGLATLDEMSPFFLVYLLLALIAAMSMAFAVYGTKKIERKVFKKQLSEQQCDGCIDCFIERIHRLSGAVGREEQEFRHYLE